MFLKNFLKERVSNILKQILKIVFCLGESKPKKNGQVLPVYNFLSVRDMAKKFLEVVSRTSTPEAFLKVLLTFGKVKNNRG